MQNTRLSRTTPWQEKMENKANFNNRRQNPGDRRQEEKIENKANLGKPQIGVSSLRTS